jgi:Icc-related predicted phosphoesterase
MANRGAPIRQHWDLIPTDTQILVTHGPAYGHLDLVPAEYVQNGRDRHQGCEELRKTIDERLKGLRLHAYSHLHSEGCQTKVVNGVTFVNGSVVGEDYRVRGQIQVVNL